MILTVTLGVIAAAASLCADSAMADGDDLTLVEHAALWEQAAQDRDWAGQLQQKNAQAMQRQANDMLTQAFRDETARKKTFRKAGDLERKAGDLMWAASLNFDRTCTNWLKVAEMSRKNEDPTKRKQAEMLADVARQNSRMSLRQAGECYEMAAEAYGENNAGELADSASASEKAGALKERLATVSRSSKPTPLLRAPIVLDKLGKPVVAAKK
jgi:hypothetical protein